jgi:hypothetical protein
MIVGNTISANEASFGGGVYVKSCTITISGNIITANNVVADGAGVACSQSSGEIVNNLVAGNSAGIREGDSGGGLDFYMCGSGMKVINNTIIGNTAGEWGGGIQSWAGGPSISNCILWDNTAQIGPQVAANAGASPIVRYCDVQGGTGQPWFGTGCIDSDPLFEDSEGRLSAGSPCIDVGDNSAIAGIATDLDGNPRIVNGTVDMGAYEALPDSDGDGVPDNEDEFPNDPTEWVDSDGDGVGDNGDAFPNDPSETSDSDGDGVGDNSDAFPNDPYDWIDTDSDGLGDNAENDIHYTDPLDPDTDDDGLLDGTEVEMAGGSGCPDPLNPDSDGDTLLDGGEVDAGTSPCNADSDGDGIPDNIDPYPLDPERTETYIESNLRDLAYFILTIDLNLFTGPNNNANKGRRGSLSNRANAAANEVANANYQEAINILLSMFDRVDGVDPPKDWMVDSPDKDDLAVEATLMIELLEYYLY